MPRERIITAVARMLEWGKPSKFIQHAERYIQPHDKVFLACRVSRCTQDHTGNLDESEASLRQEMSRLRAVVVGVERYVGPASEPYWVEWAAIRAKECGAKILVAETTDRFVRHWDYHSSKHPDKQASARQLRRLSWHTDGVTLATIVHPDASPGECRSYQTQRGQRCKGRKGGRPRSQEPGYKKRRREEELEDVLCYHYNGASVRDAAALLGIPKSTVQDWITKYA